MFSHNTIYMQIVVAAWTDLPRTPDGWVWFHSISTVHLMPDSITTAVSHRGVSWIAFQKLCCNSFLTRSSWLDKGLVHPNHKIAITTNMPVLQLWYVPPYQYNRGDLNSLFKDCIYFLLHSVITLPDPLSSPATCYTLPRSARLHLVIIKLE